MFWKQKEQQAVQELYNPVLISKIQPQGNLKLDRSEGTRLNSSH